MQLEPSQLRASDDDREQTVSDLQQHHADGRLTIAEFTERMHRALEARTLGDLELLSRDLPLLSPLPDPVLPSSAVVAKRRCYQHLLSYAWTNLFLVALWMLGCAAVGHWMFFWPMWTLLGWGLVVGSHAARVFRPQGDDPGHPGRPAPRRQRRDHHRLRPPPIAQAQQSRARAHRRRD